MNKFDYIITIISIIGVGVLFFFPEPETNFLAYLATALLFITTAIALTIWKNKKKR